MKTFERLLTIRLGRQVERQVAITKRGRMLWQPVASGATFAGLFPDLVGQQLEFGPQAVEFADRPRLLTAVQWLLNNGYL